jgi:hypothetical protein
MKKSTFWDDYGIWMLAFGYFTAYAPYSALTKALTEENLIGRLVPGMTKPIGSFEILPVANVAALVGVMIFITWKGWWVHAGRKKILGVEVPFPNRWTFMSGICTGLIVATTTLAYTFKDVSIVFVMLMLRGGVLIIGPIVDFLARRKVKWYSWVGSLLSIVSLLVAFGEKAGAASSITTFIYKACCSVSAACAINVGIYIMSYFVRLRFMSKLAKSDDENANIRYFVEEQMVATPFTVLVLAVTALLGGQGQFMEEVRTGFTTFFSSQVVLYGILVGLLSSGTGIFGGLILLDKRENTYCVPVNRSSSILAGVLASYILMWWLGGKVPSGGELAGAGIIILAILFLTIPTMLKKKE